MNSGEQEVPSKQKVLQKVVATFRGTDYLGPMMAIATRLDNDSCAVYKDLTGVDLVEVLESLAGVAVQLTDLQVRSALQQHLGQHYDRAVGDQVLQELLQRSDDAPIVESPDSYALGAGFPLHALRSVIRSFAAGLLSMEASQELHRDREDAYRRRDHGFQLAGPPGVGKTTGATAACAGLHHACRIDAVELLPAATEAWERMRQRIQLSLSPSKMLVFRLDLSLGGLQRLHPVERPTRFDNILALRLLYAVVQRNLCSTSYAEFLAALPPALLRSLKPQHVADFVRQQAGFVASDNLLMIWIFDEAQAFDAQVGSAASAPAIAQLLSAFVDFRVDCAKNRSATMPVFVTASTLWSRTLLLQTSSHQSTIADLQLLPLNERQCKLIFQSICRRIQRRQQQQQQQQQVEELRQQLLQLGQWPQFNLQPSASLEDVPLHDTTVAMLQLTGGIPRLLSYCLAAMAHAPATMAFTADLLLPWLTSPPEDFHTSKNLLTVGVSMDQRWQSFTQKGTRLLLDVAFSHDILHEPVRRTNKVATPELISSIISSGSSATETSSSSTAQVVQALSSITWELGEQHGLWLLMTDGGRKHWLSDPVHSDPSPMQEGEVPGYFVRVVPLLMAAFPPINVSSLAAVMPVLRGNIAWREREHQDVGVLAVRCLVATKMFGFNTMTLHRLLKGREFLQRGSGGLLGVEVWLPRQQIAVRVVPEQLNDQKFNALVERVVQDYERQPFAFLGPGNKAADGWLVLRQVAYDDSGVAGPGAPFIIYTSSKQRRNLEAVSGAAIATESSKDIISRKYTHAYVYVTDQQVVDAPPAPGIVAISPQEHELFYGCYSQLLNLSRV